MARALVRVAESNRDRLMRVWTGNVLHPVRTPFPGLPDPCRGGWCAAVRWRRL